MKRAVGWVVTMVLGALPAAASGGGEGGAGPFAGDLGNAIWTLLTFGLVVLVLGKWAWGPLLRALQSREEFIRSALAAAQEERDAAKALLAEYEEKLHTARAEATAIVEEGRRDGEDLKRRLDEQARSEADKMIERAGREISIAQETAVKELYELSGRLATTIASRLIRRELDPAAHAELIAESIAELERQGDAS